MTAQPANSRALIDAARDSVAREIATLRRDAARERELRDAQFAARMAELETRISAVSELERKVADRLASLKDGEAGRDGRDGVDGAAGRDGVDGLTGAAGRDGANGVDGSNGADGRDGTSVSVEEVQAMVHAECERILSAWERPQDGRSVTVDDVASTIEAAISAAVAALPAAKDGRDGVDGAAGKDGRDGVDGKDGERGAEGPAGKLPIVTKWEDRVHYEGEVVTRLGSVFQAISDTGKEPGHEDWRCIVAAGVDGQDGSHGRDGRSFNIRDTWAENEEYLALDVVALNGASFAARRDNPGPCPGEGWQMIAMQGKQGKPGDRGNALKGDRGPPGAPIVAANIDDEGLLTLTNGDGSTVTCDLYPVLSKLEQ